MTLISGDRLESTAQSKSDPSRYHIVRGSNGRILVDIEKAKQAMDYAMKQNLKDRHSEQPEENEDSRYHKVRGSQGRIIVDVKKAQQAMDYAMKQHAIARRKAQKENVEEV